MTNADSSHRTLSTVQEVELSESVKTLTQRVNQLEEQLEKLSQNALQTTEHVSLLVEAQQGFLQREQNILQNLERLTVMTEQIIQQQASTNAAVERQERILDYLMGRDGKGEK
jgi:Ni,Fe-hydrogenase III large subunit